MPVLCLLSAVRAATAGGGSSSTSRKYYVKTDEYDEVRETKPFRRALHSAAVDPVDYAGERATGSPRADHAESVK